MYRMLYFFSAGVAPQNGIAPPAHHQRTTASVSCTWLPRRLPTIVSRFSAPLSESLGFPTDTPPHTQSAQPFSTQLYSTQDAQAQYALPGGSGADKAKAPVPGCMPMSPVCRNSLVIWAISSGYLHRFAATFSIVHTCCENVYFRGAEGTACCKDAVGRVRRRA